MSFFRHKSTPKAEVPVFTGIKVQTSSHGVPIQIVYGCAKISHNLIWTGDFRWYWQQSGHSGKGGVHSSDKNGTNIYHAAFLLGLCEGPISATGLVWNGNGYYFGGNANYLYTGTTPQTGISAPGYPVPAISYPGVAYYHLPYFEIDASGTLPQFQFEVFGLGAFSLVNSIDADPAFIINDFLTNQKHGVRFPAGSIGTLFGASGDSSYQTYCQATGIAMSPSLVNQESASSTIARWLVLSNTAAVWSGGVLKFIPYGDSTITGTLFSGATTTYVPNTTPIYSLDDRDFITNESDDPIQISRLDPFSIPNWVSIEIANRRAAYDTMPIEVWDQNAIELYGIRKNSDTTAHEICDPVVGQKVAQLLLQRALYINREYSFRLSFEYCLLDPMDLVMLTDPAIGLNGTIVRITSIEEDADGFLNVTAEQYNGDWSGSILYASPPPDEYPGIVATPALPPPAPPIGQGPAPGPGGTGTVVSVPTQPNLAVGIDKNVVPPPVNTPMLHEPAAAMTGGIAQIWIGASGGTPPIYILSEDISTGQHGDSTTTISQPIGAEVEFVRYVKLLPSGTRTKCRMQCFDGVATQSVDFDLTLASDVASTSGITSKQIIGDQQGWYRLSIKFLMQATAVVSPAFRLLDASGALTYTGLLGHGLYVWGEETATILGNSTDPLSMIGPFTTLVGITSIQNSASPPIGVSDPNWGGCIVNISLDNVTYMDIGVIQAPVRQGFLTAALSAPVAGVNPDTTHTLSVNLSESAGSTNVVLDTSTNQAAMDGVTLCLVDTELMAYANATLTGANSYDMTYLNRGLYGSTPTSHLIGAPFARVDSTVLQYPLPQAYVGRLLYFKFQSFNIYGNSKQDISTCRVYTYNALGTGGRQNISTLLSSARSVKLGRASDPVPGNVNGVPSATGASTQSNQVINPTLPRGRG